jgi:predicted DNA-binding transcriptional regulator YafY
VLTTVDPAVLVAVSDAVRTYQVLRFDYGSDDQHDRPPRRVQPHAVVARNGRWYLLAWDPDAGDWRTYRIDRVRPRTATGLLFTPRPIPGGDPAAFVAARFKGSDVIDAWPCTGTVVLHVPARQVAPYLEPDVVLEDLDPDRCRITLGSWSWTALAAKVAGFDAPFDVLGPDEFRVATRTLAARLVAASDQDS